MKPLLLITNDDGIKSPAIPILINLFEKEYSIVVVAPKFPQSAKGCSHAHGDSWVTITKESIKNIDWITVDNSPATCVSVALKHLNIKPDLVISGITSMSFGSENLINLTNISFLISLDRSGSFSSRSFKMFRSV